MNTRHLPIAVRGLTVRKKRRRSRRERSQRVEDRWRRHVILMDFETTTDTAQRLNFGFYRFCKWSADGSRLITLSESLVHADDLEQRYPEGFSCLRRYVASHKAEVGDGVARRLKLVSRSDFVENVLWRLGYRSRALIVAFNLPFDLSRLALDDGLAQGDSRGGFSLVLWAWEGEDGEFHENRYRPRVIVQHIDSRMSFIHFTRPYETDRASRRPTEGAAPDASFGYGGSFLDLRMLTSALRGRGHSLASACDAFRIEHPKKRAERHGFIDPGYIDYARGDVRALKELLEKARAEFDSLDVELDPCQAYSSASIAKAYFRGMGLSSPAEQFADFPLERIGQATSAFFGGRSEVRIRKKIVPVAYVDFLSMYPTLETLMGLWELLRAERLEIVDATADFQRLLNRATLGDVFRPEFWRELRGFAQIVPGGDVLPVRAKHDGSEWTLGIDHLTTDSPMWFAIPDLVADKLLHGRAPTVRSAIRLVPSGIQESLRTIRLGDVVVDPRSEDFFKALIEQRQRIKRDEHLSQEERDQRQLPLKIQANAGAYGVFIEMIRKELPAKVSETISVYGREGHFECESEAPEEPGPYCFPPIASLITAGARLLLAALERCVTDLGGSYSFADTDSMAIVASESGGLVVCEGGRHRLPDGCAAVLALSWEEIDAIRARFGALTPYDRAVVPESILELETENFDSATGLRREIYAYAISAKRYALFTIEADGSPVIVKHSEHGLGQLMNPTDPDSDDSEWIQSTWRGIVEEALGGPRFEPEWVRRPALMKCSVSTPHVMRRFDRINRNRNRKKPYGDRVKQSNFVLSVTVSYSNLPGNINKTNSLNLIAPYSSDPHDWERMKWTDLHSGEEYRIKSTGKSTPGGRIRIETFEDVLEGFRHHAESKSTGSDGQPANRTTVGLLGRQHVKASLVFHIGKESNLLDAQEKGLLVADPQAVYPAKADWERVRSMMHGVSIRRLSELTGYSERTLFAYRNGTRTPPSEKVLVIATALGWMCEER